MKNGDGGAANGTAHQSARCRLCTPALRPADKTAALTRVRYLEHELFDDSGHLRRGITAELALDSVALINQLRRALGWLEIDLDSRWRWPAKADHVGWASQPARMKAAS